MANAILEIDDSSAHASFLEGFSLDRQNVPEGADLTLQNEPALPNEAVVDRVLVDAKTAICPRTSSELRLLQLDSQQREELMDSIFFMAREQFIEWNTSREDDLDPQFATDSLYDFVMWLENREGKPYTTIVGVILRLIFVL